MSDASTLPTIPHAGVLEDLATMPAYVMPDHHGGHPANGRFSCCYCGVGDSGQVVINETKRGGDQTPSLPLGEGLLWIKGKAEPYAAMVTEDRRLWVRTSEALTTTGGVLAGDLELDGKRMAVTVREVERKLTEGGKLFSQVFVPYRRSLSVTNSQIVDTVPTRGCVKLKHATMRQRVAFPIHIAPSVRQGGERRSITYAQAVSRLADLVLAHRGQRGKILLYCTGQLDYIAIFAIQEVFRLLGVRNLTGNAEHCLNAGASHNELLTGQEGPFLTLEQAIEGPDRLFLFNGWNGFISHPPAFLQVLKRDDLDVYMVEVMVTESVKAVAKKVGVERILLIKPGTDPHLALAVGHEILTRHAAGLEPRFLERFADAASFERYRALALDPRFAPEAVARRIAAEPAYEANLLAGIRGIAARMAKPGVVPINIPSVGLSQTTGVVAHCLWGNTMAMVGKYGLRPDGTPAGGTLRIPGQINAESEIQGLSGKIFMGRIPIEQHEEAARRMGLPAGAYAAVATDAHRAALDYSEYEQEARPELFICFGTQFEANMMNRPKWLEKLADPDTTLVVVDPIPDPYTLENAELVVPSPPHPATTKVYQNGEWKLSLSVPQKLAPPQTRSDATIVYDLMAEIVERLAGDESLRRAHPDLAAHLESGYLRRRFCPPILCEDDYGVGGLLRVAGEVSRPQLWKRVLDYLGGTGTAGGTASSAAAGDGAESSKHGPLYCLPTHADGRLVQWSDLLDNAGVIYGGVGTTRYKLDYDDPQAVPFRDIYRRPGCFRFFTPTERDLEVPEGLVLNSGRSTLSDDKELVRFASSTFNSGKATPIVGMPANNPLYVSPQVAARLQLRTGDDARITNRETGDSIVLPVVVSDRVKGQVLYTSFHKTVAQMERGLTVNTVTSHRGRCPYSNQTKLKVTSVSVERIQPFRAVGDADGDVPPLVRSRNVRIELELGDADSHTLAPR
jgi:anaerobic selenocysteine-containing dehydrogenase